MLQLAESVEELDGIGFTSKRHGHKALLLDVAADLGKACICLSRLLLVTVHRKFHPIKQIKTQTQLHTSFWEQKKNFVDREVRTSKEDASFTETLSSFTEMMLPSSFSTGKPSPADHQQFIMINYQKNTTRDHDIAAPEQTEDSPIPKTNKKGKSLHELLIKF